jgi:hypothetical protein
VTGGRSISVVLAVAVACLCADVLDAVPALAHANPPIAQRFATRDVGIRYAKLVVTHGQQPDGSNHEYRFGPGSSCEGVGSGRPGREYYRKAKKARVWSHFRCTGPGLALSYWGGPLRPICLAWTLHASGRQSYESAVRELWDADGSNPAVPASAMAEPCGLSSSAS